MRILVGLAILSVFSISDAWPHGGGVDSIGGHCHREPIGYHLGKKDDELDTAKNIDASLAGLTCPRLSEDFDPERIYWAQCMLSVLEHEPWLLDGIQGPATSSAIKRFLGAHAERVADADYCVSETLIEKLKAAMGADLLKCPEPPGDPDCIIRP